MHKHLLHRQTSVCSLKRSEWWHTAGFTCHATDRPQDVSVDSCVSKNTEAPQVGVLGPFLFTVYYSNVCYKSAFCWFRKFYHDYSIVGCITMNNIDYPRNSPLAPWWKGNGEGRVLRIPWGWNIQHIGTKLFISLCCRCDGDFVPGDAQRINNQWCAWFWIVWKWVCEKRTKDNYLDLYILILYYSQWNTFFSNWV